MDATNALLTRFKHDKLLNADSAGRRIILHGSIDDQPALLLAERAAFSTNPSYLADFAHSLVDIQNLGDNDVYRWYMSNSSSASRTKPEDGDPSQEQLAATAPRDLKINLIYPCTEKHIKKYTPQQARVVHETPEIYARHIRPYMQRCREEGRLNWVFNILDGKSEQENVLYRSSASVPKDDYLLLPDLNWDRATLSSLHLLALVQRRDLWSVRDLRSTDVAWLRQLRATLAQTVETLYPGIEADMLKFYVHYQPTYYHFHIHIVHVDLDAGATQAVGKALGLDDVISRLQSMDRGSAEAAGMDEVTLTYTVGEASELWTKIYGPLKAGQVPEAL